MEMAKLAIYTRRNLRPKRCRSLVYINGKWNADTIRSCVAGHRVARFLQRESCTVIIGMHSPVLRIILFVTCGAGSEYQVKFLIVI